MPARKLTKSRIIRHVEALRKLPATSHPYISSEHCGGSSADMLLPWTKRILIFSLLIHLVQPSAFLSVREKPRQVR